MASSTIEAQDRRYCWVCFAEDDDSIEEREAMWVKPCRCSGTTKWVHQSCLQRWIDEKQKGNNATKVACPQCNTEYIILFPTSGSLVYMMDVVDRIVYRVSPFIVAGILVGSIYWTAVTYGAVTVMQVLGHKEGLGVMEQADPLFLLVGLPTIPILLILSRMVHWENYVLRLWRRHSIHIPFIKYCIGGQSNTHQERVPIELPPFSDPVSASRVLCGALMMPTIATICGRLFFDKASSNLQKTILGGVTFIAVKGIMKLYYKQQQHVRQSQRQILDFDSKPHHPESH